MIDALSQLLGLRERRAEAARTEAARTERALIQARHSAHLAAQLVTEYADRQPALVTACYAPILGRQIPPSELTHARASAGEVLAERARLEEAADLARQAAEECQRVRDAAYAALHRMERRLDALIQLRDRRSAAERRARERAADELLDALAQNRFSGARSARP